MTSIYSLFDKVGKTTLVIGFGSNDAEFVRKNLAWVIKTYPLRDIEVRKYDLTFNDDTSQFTLCSSDYVVVDWNCYQFPSNSSENLKSVGISEKKSIKEGD